MASDYLLEIEGIKGESQDSKHNETIEIDSFSWGVSNAGTRGGGGGGGAGKVVFQDIHFTKHVDKSSPTLMLRCATGEHIKKAVLFVRKSGGERSQDYYVISMEDILVSEFMSKGEQTGPAGAPASPIPTDQFSLNFSKIEFAYAMQKADGTLDVAVKGGWDLKSNKGG